MSTVRTALFAKKETASTPVNITDRIKTFEDACQATGMFPQELVVNGEGLDEKDILAAAAFHKLTIIAKALNEGWKPDWTNSSEYKYYPWFDMTSGSSAVCDSYYRWRSHSNVGSRLCFKSRALAEYAGKQFQKEYEQMFLF